MLGAPQAETRDISQVVDTIAVAGWHKSFDTWQSTAAITALEAGKVLLLERLPFWMSEDERQFLTSELVGPKAKNVAYNPRTKSVKHATVADAAASAIATMMGRYCDDATALISALLPQYAATLEVGRTSFRPAEIRGRASSKNQDDTLLHVDAFPTTPVGNKRILRIFTNTNPNLEPRVWRIGEPFEDVAMRFLPKVRRPLPGSRHVLKSLGLTKAYRTDYDHLMLGIHLAMKETAFYQKHALQNEFRFSPGSTWLVFTDQVSHAAMSGQFAFEQTFYVPVAAMTASERSPLRVLERLTGRTLA
jgi:hypothetical protein